jgi:hypothetical protein
MERFTMTINADDDVVTPSAGNEFADEIAEICTIVPGQEQRSNINGALKWTYIMAGKWLFQRGHSRS